MCRAAGAPKAHAVTAVRFILTSKFIFSAIILTSDDLSAVAIETRFLLPPSHLLYRLWQAASCQSNVTIKQPAPRWPLPVLPVLVLLFGNGSLRREALPDLSPAPLYPPPPPAQALSKPCPRRAGDLVSRGNGHIFYIITEYSGASPHTSEPALAGSEGKGI